MSAEHARIAKEHARVAKEQLALSYWHDDDSVDPARRLGLPTTHAQQALGHARKAGDALTSEVAAEIEHRAEWLRAVDIASCHIGRASGFQVSAWARVLDGEYMTHTGFARMRDGARKLLQEAQELLVSVAVSAHSEHPSVKRVTAQHEEIHARLADMPTHMPGAHESIQVPAWAMPPPRSTRPAPRPL